jgi:hypothetical protein
MNRRTTATTVGCLFVTQMVTAAAGTSLIQGFLDGDHGAGPMRVGVLLTLVSGVAVALIGLLMYPVLRPVNPGLAAWYPILRLCELGVVTLCGVYLLARLDVVPNHLLWVYVPTGLGGIVLTWLLFVSRLVPRPIAVLGLVGYACLTAGVPLDLLGLLRMDHGAGQVLLVPGGLFEVAVLPTWLIAKGFGSSSPSGTGVAPVLATSG